ncbi:MAG: sulfatase-like hydrolase/transferase, partial [Verrucomicrobiota bacterium]
MVEGKALSEPPKHQVVHGLLMADLMQFHFYRFLRKATSGYLAALSFWGAMCAETPPNIVVIMSDDQGRWALGSYDARIHTPNLDFLARTGVRFDQAISPVPVCSAARASFFTGKMPSQHGVHDFLSEDFADPDGWLNSETLLSEELQEAGYRVGLFGKWHADTAGWRPVRGFDRWLSYDEREAPWINQYLHAGTVHFSRDGEAESFTGVQAHFLSENAVDFIDESGEHPFAVFLNFVEPHFPFEDLPERLVSRYRPVAQDIVAAGGFSSIARPAMAGAVVDDHSEQLAQYLAAVTLLDEQVGRIMDALSGRGLID